MCLKRCPRSHRSFRRSFRKSHFFDFLRILDCANMSAFDKAGECSTLPLYTPSAPCPKYSCNPACDEQTLQQTPRITASGPRPTGTYTTKSGGVIVTLFDQANDAELPTYGRCGVVNGTIYCQNHELVSQVVVKVCNRCLHWVDGNSPIYRLKAKWNLRLPKEVQVISDS